MAISLVAVGAKITAAITNLIITALNAQGTTGIIPTSVSVAGTGSASIGATGRVTLTSVQTSVSINGCFTASYDNYEMVAVLTSASLSQVTMRLRTSVPADDSAANYDTEIISGAGATAAATGIAAGTAWTVSNASGGYTRKVIKATFISPALAATTSLLATTHDYNQASGFGIELRQIGAGNRVATSFAGFTLLFNASTTSGTIDIYGWNNNS